MQLYNLLIASITVSCPESAATKKKTRKNKQRYLFEMLEMEVLIQTGINYPTDKFK